MRELCRRLRLNIPRIIADWNMEASTETVLDIPRQHRTDDLPELLDSLVTLVTCSPEDAELEHRRMVAAAAAHGELRRKQNSDQSVLFNEHALLRRVLWRHIRDLEATQGTAVIAVLRLDVALGVATRAALHGYHRDEIEARGLWPATIERLTSESPYLKLREVAAPEASPDRHGVDTE
jgi:hypothetical protein